MQKGRWLLINVPSSFLANLQMPKVSQKNCAQSSKNMLMRPKFRTNPALKHGKSSVD